MLENRTALITGGGKGIGAATAAALSRAGAKVIIADLDISLANATAASISADGGHASAYQLDVANREAIAEMAIVLAANHDPISILVNNAGIVGGLPIDDPKVMESWDREIAVNLTGVVVVTRAFLKPLRETKGTVVNLASVASFQAVTGGLGYQASKAGVKILTQTLARELGKDGVRVNAVAPGIIQTDMSAAVIANPTWLATQLSRIPLERVGTATDVADSIVFLCSDKSRYLTGVILPVDGGFLAV
ncbi:glucose 1-dehydrogenase [Sphingomonas oligophenolica]|uniref:SDR family NAD(P)-dependent oxidoreductase n=1 Tax=Sphingomonas oligophenolica TaxID=301154 RepID=A0ABU9YBS0_9SPHN